MKKYRYYLRKSIQMVTAAALIFVTLAVGRTGLAEMQNKEYAAETSEKALLYDEIVLG